MKKQNIVQKKREFNQIIRNQQSYKNKYMSIYINNNSFNYYRFGISIPKKYGIAVERNKIKRQIKQIIDNNQNLFQKGKDYIIIVRDYIKNVKYQSIEQIIIETFNDINKRRGA